MSAPNRLPVGVDRARVLVQLQTAYRLISALRRSENPCNPLNELLYEADNELSRAISRLEAACPHCGVVSL